MVDDKRFDWLVLLVILFNCGVMALETPGNSPHMGERRVGAQHPKCPVAASCPRVVRAPRGAAVTGACTGSLHGGGWPRWHPGWLLWPPSHPTHHPHLHTKSGSTTPTRMALLSSPAPAADLLADMEWGCLAFYIAELVAKMLALGAVRCMHAPWPACRARPRWSRFRACLEACLCVLSSLV